VVGAAWGCPVISAGIGAGTDLDVLYASLKAAKRGAKVINLSLGTNVSPRCGTVSDLGQVVAQDGADIYMFKALFAGPFGRDVVWTISAGNNCLERANSAWGLAGANLDNVLTVASVNSDGNLSMFSNFGLGVKVAAPGGWSVPPAGIGTTGVYSTWINTCLLGPCSSYAADLGTSMAAPIVAGVAALVRSAHPDFDASQVGRCVMQAAGLETGFVTSRDLTPSLSSYRAPSPTMPFRNTGIGIINAEASVRCETSHTTSPPGRILFLGPHGVTQINADGTGDKVLIDRFCFCGAYARWSSDQKQIAMGSNGGGLAVMNSDGSDFHVIVPPPGGGVFYLTGGWSPDGSKLVVNELNTAHGDDLAIANGDGTGLHPIPNTGRGFNPRWSPDGGDILFDRPDDANGSTYNVYLIHPDGSALRKITHDRFASRADWSPDGRQIVYVCSDDSNFYHRICVANADGTGERTLLADSDHMLDFPTWSPDGNWLAFNSDAQIALIPQAGGTPVKLAQGENADWGP
jgi:hypothetical protein